MNDLKEELLDIGALLTKRLRNLEVKNWFFLIFPLCLWPLFYILMALSIFKLIISWAGAASIAFILHKGLLK
tara:strand:- start:1275 stop:1490 length:216 start_codon:yes stop_codon:yes gene_type:complete